MANDCEKVYKSILKSVEKEISSLKEVTEIEAIHMIAEALITLFGQTLAAGRYLTRTQALGAAQCYVRGLPEIIKKSYENSRAVWDK